jgi:hypothetical protein
MHAVNLAAAWRSCRAGYGIKEVAGFSQRLNDSGLSRARWSGNDKENSVPLNRLLKVLNLLADLLQFGLATDDALRDCSVIGFRSERVEFAKNLLRDEFQCAPNRLFAAQMMGKLSKMTLEPRQLFRYISAIGKERNLLSRRARPR